MLLDTHIWIWLLEGNNRLPAHLLRRIEAEPDRLWLSPVSLWEAVMLAEGGRISVKGPPTKFFREALAAGPFREAPLTNEVALKSRELKFPHEDPADRFIAATATVYQIPLVTADERLRGISWLETV